MAAIPQPPRSPDGGDPQSRTAHFQIGHSGDPAGGASVLEHKPTDPDMPWSARGVLQQIQRAPAYTSGASPGAANGMSAQDAGRRFIGQNLPTHSYSGEAGSPEGQEKVMTMRATGHGPRTSDSESSLA